LLNDVISKSEEHFGADSYEVGYALCILELRAPYCPAEPATSSMDIALRAAGIYRRMELNPVRDWNIIDLCITAHVLVPATRIYIGQDFYNAGQREGK
jgi:hypothetical protein